MRVDGEIDRHRVSRQREVFFDALAGCGVVLDVRRAVVARAAQHPQRAVGRERDAAWLVHGPCGLLLHRLGVVHLDAIARSVRREQRGLVGRQAADFRARAGWHFVHHQEARRELRMRVRAFRGGLERRGTFRIGDLAARNTEPLLALLRPHALLDQPPLFVADRDRHERILAIDRDRTAAAIAPAMRAAREAEHLAVLIDAGLRAALVPGRVGVDLAVGRHRDRGDVDLRPCAVTETEAVADP